MSLADNLHRQLDIAEAALALRKAGIPKEMTALCYSDSSQDAAAAKEQVMRHYGIKSEEVLAASGCNISVARLGWARGRGVGITTLADHRAPKEIRTETGDPIIGTKQEIES